MPKDVFIGYSRDDLEAAKAVEACLKAAGISCFLDTGIPDAAQWADTIAAAIEECKVFLAIVSENSLAKPKFVNRELSFAVELDKPCIPVVLSREIALPRVIRFHLSVIQYIYAEPSIEAVLPRIAAAAAEVINRQKHTKEWADRDHVRNRANYEHQIDCSAHGFGLVDYDAPQGTGKIEGRGFVLTSAAGQYTGHHLDRLQPTSDFVFEVTLRHCKGPSDQWFGVEFGASWPGDYYQFLLNADGAVHGSVHFRKVWSPQFHYEGLPFVHSGGRKNRVVVVRRDSFFHFFANEQWVASTEDAGIWGSTPGLMVAWETQVEFSDMRVAGVSVDLEPAFRDALQSWHELDMTKAKPLLESVARYDPAFRVGGWPQDVSCMLREVRPDRSESILISIGSGIMPQLQDRKPAERLRDEINQKGGDVPFRWAAIATDRALLENPVYCRCPIVSVGGGVANQFTHGLQESLVEDPRSTGGVHIQNGTNPEHRHVALWGESAEETAAAVDIFVTSDLLDSFLASIWKSSAL